MAIAPNTTFVSGAILTAAQMNALPWGIVAIATSPTTVTYTTTETVALTTGSFTAVANRYYRITYCEPTASVPGGAGNYFITRLRLTNLAGTQIAQGQAQATGATQAASNNTLVFVSTLSAGSTVIVATVQTNTATSPFYRAANGPAILTVEDIGPA